MQTVRHIKYTNETTHNSHTNHHQPSNKRQKMLLNDNRQSAIHCDNLRENKFSSSCEHKMAIITPNINSYREPTDDELADWSNEDMERCSYENFLNYHVQFLVHDQNNYDDTHYMAIRDVEESAVSMAINEHGLHGQNEIESSQPLLQTAAATFANSPETRITVALSTVPEVSVTDDKTSAAAADTAEQSNPIANARGLETSSSEDNYDFMEVAVSAAIERNGLISFR